MELSKSRMNIYRTLGSKKMRRRHGLFMVEGIKSVTDLLGKFQLEALIVTSDYDDEKTANFDSIDESVISTVSPQMMERMSSLTTPSAVAAVFRLPKEKNPDFKAEGLCLMLDGVQDPGNLGTIIRTAHWFGIKKIFASPDTADVFNPKTIQSTMGSLAAVDVVYCSLPEVVDANPGMPVYGLLLEGRSIYEAKKGTEGFILMGNEGNGISEEMRKKITEPLLIPPYNSSDHSESLNVAIATGITLSLFRSPER